jgi:hypothetical protein
MKTMTHQQLFGPPTPKSIRNTRARIARARLIVAAARERAVEMAYSPPRQSATRESQRRRLAQLQSRSPYALQFAGEPCPNSARETP